MKELSYTKSITEKANSIRLEIKKSCLDQSKTLGYNPVLGNMVSQAPIIEYMKPENIILPKGYYFKQVELSNCNAYLIKKRGDKHNIVAYNIHGGGFVKALSQNNIKGAILHNKYVNCDVFEIDYSVGEFIYPRPLDDVIEGYKYLLKHYKPENILLTGQSAGGNLALALALKLRDNNIPFPRCVCVASPWADIFSNGESYIFNKENDVLFGSYNTDRVILPNAYCKDNDYYANPVEADFKKLPPILIQMGSAEVLLSDSLTIYNKCDNIKMIAYKDLWHDFYTNTDEFTEAKRAWLEIASFFEATKIEVSL